MAAPVWTVRASDDVTRWMSPASSVVSTRVRTASADPPRLVPAGLAEVGVGAAPAVHAAGLGERRDRVPDEEQPGGPVEGGRWWLRVLADAGRLGRVDAPAVGRHGQAGRPDSAVRTRIRPHSSQRSTSSAGACVMRFMSTWLSSMWHPPQRR